MNIAADPLDVREVASASHPSHAAAHSWPSSGMMCGYLERQVRRNARQSQTGLSLMKRSTRYIPGRNKNGSNA